MARSLKSYSKLFLYWHDRDLVGQFPQTNMVCSGKIAKTKRLFQGGVCLFFSPEGLSEARVTTHFSVKAIFLSCKGLQ